MSELSPETLQSTQRCRSRSPRTSTRRSPDEADTLGNALKPYSNILDFSLGRDEIDDDIAMSRNQYQKAHDRCRRYRRAASKFFRTTFYYEALIQYSESLKHALIDHEDFPRTCNKRSILLFFLGFYKECLADLDMLARATYDFRDDIDERELRRKAATENLKRQMVPSRGLSPLKATEQSVQIKNCCQAVMLLAKEGSNKKILTAVKDIAGDQLLMTESPYISAPIIQETLTCWECMDVVVNPIPCETCSLAAYCSEKCKRYSWERYHEYECQLMPLMEAYYFDHSAAIRIIFSVRDYDLNLDDDGSVDSQRFKDVFKTNVFEVENLTEGEKQDILYAAEDLYQIITTRTNFLSNVRGTNLTKNEKCSIFKGMILKTLLIIRARSYQEIEIKRYVGKTCFFRSMYSSIFPILSYIEHSCTPNSCVSIHGKVARLCSIEPIHEGEPITVCYTDLFTETPKEERQLILKKMYNMTCSCAACVYYWPLMDDLSNIEGADKIRLLEEIEREIPLFIDNTAVIRELHKKLIKVANYKWTKPSKAYGMYLKLAQRIYDLMNVPMFQIDIISRMHPSSHQYLDSRNMNIVRGLERNIRYRRRGQQFQQQMQQ